MDETKCVICQDNSADETLTSVSRGVENLIAWSNRRNDVPLETHLQIQNGKSPQGQVLVHPTCRRHYVDPKRQTSAKRPSSTKSSVSTLPSTPKRQKLRSALGTFNCKENCFFCDTKVIFDERHPDRYPGSRRVCGKKESVDMIHKVRVRCDARNDKLGSEVKRRLNVINDLVAAEAVYHAQCFGPFFQTGRIVTPGIGSERTSISK